MGSGIAEHAECSFYEICKAALFALLAHRRTRVDRDARGIAAKRLVDQVTAVIGESRKSAHFVRYALHSFLRGMRIIVGEKLNPAEGKNIGMAGSNLLRSG